MPTRLPRILTLENNKVAEFSIIVRIKFQSDCALITLNPTVKPTWIKCFCFQLIYLLVVLTEGGSGQTHSTRVVFTSLLEY